MCHTIRQCRAPQCKPACTLLEHVHTHASMTYALMLVANANDHQNNIACHSYQTQVTRHRPFSSRTVEVCQAEEDSSHSSARMLITQCSRATSTQGVLLQHAVAINTRLKTGNVHQLAHGIQCSVPMLLIGNCMRHYDVPQPTMPEKQRTTVHGKERP